jgi:hypothetical protein
MQHKDYSFATLPYLSIVSFSIDLVNDEFNKAHMLLIGDVVCIKNEYDLCLRLIELMQLLDDFLLGLIVRYAS